MAVVRVVKAAPYAGKKITATIEARTEDLRRGSCIVKAQTIQRLQYAGFLAAELGKLPPTTSGFERCQIDVEIPPATKWLLVGFTHAGDGTVWLRDVKLEVR